MRAFSGDSREVFGCGSAPAIFDIEGCGPPSEGLGVRQARQAGKRRGDTREPSRPSGGRRAKSMMRRLNEAHAGPRGPESAAGEVDDEAPERSARRAPGALNPRGFFSGASRRRPGGR